MVSVIIPTYNRENTILESIKSVLNSTYVDIEIIIVDDCSSDGTEELIKPLLSEKIRYVKNEKNLGIAGTRNVGIEYARGEFIAFNDSDDYWRPTKLEKQMKIMEEHPEYLLVYCAFERTNKDGRKIIIPNENEKLQGKIYETLLKKNVISTQTMLFRKECFAKCGNFNIEIKTIDDYEMALKVSKISEVGYLDEIGVDVFMSEDSVTDITKNYMKKFYDYFVILKLHYSSRNYMKYYGIVKKIIEFCCLMTEEEFLEAKSDFHNFSTQKNLSKLFFNVMLDKKLRAEDKKKVIKLFVSNDIKNNVITYKNFFTCLTKHSIQKIKKHYNT